MTFSLTAINKGTKRNKGEEVHVVVSSLNGHESIDIPRSWTVNKLPVSKRCIPTKRDISRWNHLKGIQFSEHENQNVTKIIGSDMLIQRSTSGKTEGTLCRKNFIGLNSAGTSRR